VIAGDTLNRICISIALILIVGTRCLGQIPSQPCNESTSKYANLENQAVRKVAPEYPAEPGFHVEGKVTVRIVINKKGDVVSAKAICGHPLIIAPAIKAAAQWQFQPKLVKGKPTKNIGVIVFVFKDMNRDRGIEYSAAQNKPLERTRR